MKTLILATILLGTAVGSAREPAKLWTGRQRGMDLVTIGHKHVTVLLADGRTAVVDIPILVEQPNPYRTRLRELQRKQQELQIPADPRLHEISETLRTLDRTLQDR